MFKKLSCVKEVDDGLKFFNFTYRDENLFTYALILYDEWEYIFGDVSEITENQLDELSLDKIMCMSKEDFDRFLDDLVNEDIIRIDRLLSPCVIVRLKPREFILEHIYSRM